MTNDLQREFAACFEKLSGNAHTAATETEAAETIVSIIRSHQAECVALAGLPESLVSKIETQCDGIKVLKEPYAAEALPGAIDKADVGVTGMSFAIAQTGTLVEVSTNDAVRLVSGLPSTHIGVVHQRDIIDRFEEGAAHVRRIVNQHDQNVVISFISGPSRTGDIELKLTLGVHGPEEAHAVVIGK